MTTSDGNNSGNKKLPFCWRRMLWIPGQFYGGSSDWNSSDIHAWLNNTGNTTGSSKVFLLSYDEANDNAYFADNNDRATGVYWWFRSPVDLAHYAAYVLHSGNMNSIGVYTSFGIRPALKVNLASDIFSFDDL